VLKDVGKKVSGVLTGPRDEGAADGGGSPVPTGVTPGGAAPGVAAPGTGSAGPPQAGTADREDPVTPSSLTPPADEALAEPALAPGTDVPDAGPAPVELDAVCAAAVELARTAAVEDAGDAVGDHLGVEPEATPVGAAVTHSFAARLPGYGGWRWAVTVARGDGSDRVTVDEVVLLPGRGALLAPPWVPWSDRVQAGDLTPGDLLPPPSDDPRLVPSYADVDAPELPFDLHRELGLGRPRVLSAEGLAEAAERWYDGEAGPDTPLAKAAPGRCGGCGFLVPLTGSLGRVFGACGNAMAPDDGRVVALTHGCGAHSETVLDAPAVGLAGMAVEDDEFELVAVADVRAVPQEPALEDAVGVAVYEATDDAGQTVAGAAGGDADEVGAAAAADAAGDAGELAVFEAVEHADDAVEADVSAAAHETGQAAADDVAAPDVAGSGAGAVDAGQPSAVDADQPSAVDADQPSAVDADDHVRAVDADDTARAADPATAAAAAPTEEPASA
jgi:hypothetical protein